MISEELVGDDRLPLLVPEDGNGDPSGEARFGGGVDLVKVPRAVDRVGNDPVRGLERPTVFAHEPVGDRKIDHAFQPLQGPEDERAVRPRTRVRDVEVVASRLRLEPALAGGPGSAVGRDPVAEGAVRALEPASGGLGVIPPVRPDAVDEQSHGSSPCLWPRIGARPLSRPGAWRYPPRGGPGPAPASVRPRSVSATRRRRRWCWHHRASRREPPRCRSVPGSRRAGRR